jgi:hypothetical protein
MGVCRAPGPAASAGGLGFLRYRDGVSFPGFLVFRPESLFLGLASHISGHTCVLVAAGFLVSETGPQLRHL